MCCQVADKLQALNDEFAAMTKKKRDLEDNIELCSQKLDRAEKLIGKTRCRAIIHHITLSLLHATRKDVHSE